MGTLVKTSSSQGLGSYLIELDAGDVGTVTFSNPVDWASGVSIHVFAQIGLRGRISVETSLASSGETDAWTISDTYEVPTSHVQNARIERMRFTASSAAGKVRILCNSDIDIEIT